MPRSLLLILVLGIGAPTHADWLCFRLAGHHGPTVTCHDSSSGLFVRVRRAAPDPWYSDQRASRLLRTGTTSDGIELAEFGDPASDVEQLAEDIGEPPSPGSFTEAVLLAFRPPASCPAQLEYRCPESQHVAVFVTATVCSDEQRARLAEFVSSRGWERISPVVDTSQADQVTPMTEAEFERIAAGQSIASVISQAGAPDDLWPRYPTGLTLIYPAHQSAEAIRFAITLSIELKVQATQRLLQDTWSASE